MSPQFHLFSATGLAFLLVGCGGGSGGAGADVAPATPSQTVATVASSASSQSSAASSVGTALADTTALSPDDLSVYVTQHIQLATSGLEFSGRLQVVKVQSSRGNTLFLGQWPKTVDFDLSVYTELASFPLRVEVFTESKNDSTVTWEVSYEG